MNRAITLLLSVSAWFGLLALCGWAFDIELLRRLYNGAMTMNPVTAVCLIISSSALWRIRQLQNSHTPRVGILIAGILLCLIAGIRLLDGIGLHSNIDHWLFMQKLEAEAAQGKIVYMPYNVGIAFFLLGLVYVFEYARRVTLKKVTTFITAVVFILGTYATIGLILRVKEYGDILHFVLMAPQTAISLICISLALLLCNREHGFMKEINDDHLGGRIARWLIPAAILVPVAIAYARLYFFTWKYHYSVELGVTVLSTGIAVVFAVVVWFLARALNDSDARREESEQRLKREALLFNTTPGPVIYGNRNSVITEANPAAEKLFGVPREKLIGSRVDDFVKAEFRGETRENARAQIWDGTGQWKGELAFTFPDGKQVELLATTQAMESADGKRDSWMAVYTEITNLRHVQERLEYALEGMQAGLWEWNVVHPKQSWMSSRYRQMLGYTEAELPGTGLGFMKLVRPEELQMFLQYFKERAAEKVPFERQIEHLCGNGQYRWFLVTGNVKLDSAGNTVSLIGSIIDIDDKKRTQITVQQQADLINMMPDGVIYGRIDSTIVRINNGAEKILGAGTGEVIGKKWQDVLHINPIGNTLMGRTRELQRTGFLREELEVTNNAGEKFLVLASTKMFDNLLNEGPGWIIVFTDITPLKLNNQLKAANDYLEQLAYISAHDLKSPLISIQGLTGLLVASKDIAGEDREVVSILEETITRMASNNRALNEVLRMRKTLEAEVQTSTLAEVVEDVKGVLTGALNQSGATLNINLTGAGILSFPAVQLQTAIQNLLSNAIKYRDPNRPLVIDLTATEDKNNNLRLVVKDNGLGFDAERNKNRVFGLFKRFHTHTEGTGAGLYMVKTMLDSVGGNITVESTEGVGSTFVITLKPTIIAS